MNVVTRGIRNAFRNTIRTGSLVMILGLSIGLALSMLVARQAVSQKIESVKSSIGNTITVSPAGVRGFDGGGNPLTGTQLNKVTSLSHVTGVEESLNDRLTTSDTNLVSSIQAGSLGRRFGREGGFGGGFGGASGGTNASFTPPIAVIGTTNPTVLSAVQGGGTFKLTSGTVFDGASSQNVAVIGSDLASKNNLKVGSTFTAYGNTITVSGIYDAGNTFANSQLSMPLKTLQTLSGQPDAITSATITVDSISNLENTTTAIKNSLGSSADVVSSTDQVNAEVAPLENIKTISLYSLIGAVIAGAVIILLTMIMIVRERRREIGVLKAIGASNSKVIGQFMVEAVTLTVLGAIIGILLGVATAQPITKMLVTNSTSSATSSTQNFARGGGARIFTRPAGGLRGLRTNVSTIHTVISGSIIGYGFLAAIVIALLGSGAAAGLIAKVRPAEVMRGE